MSWLCNFFPNQSLLFTSSCSTITYPRACHVYYRIFEYIHVRSRTKNSQNSQKILKIPETISFRPEKVSKIKSTSNTNFEKAPISRKQTIFRIEIHYYRMSCCLIVALLWSNNQGSADNKISNTNRGDRLKLILRSNWWSPIVYRL